MNHPLPSVSTLGTLPAYSKSHSSSLDYQVSQLPQHRSICIPVTLILSNNGSKAIQITFTIVDCYDCSISLLIIVVNLLLCLIYEINFIIDVNTWEKT